MKAAGGNDVSNDELAGLSDAEREALEGGDDDAEALAEVAGDGTRAAEANADERDDDEPFTPLYTSKAPEKYDEQMKAFADKDATDLAEFMENKIEIDELLNRQRAINDQRAALREQKTKADIASESSQQLADQQWDWECKRFIKNTLKHEGIDYKKDPSLFGELDAQVKVLGHDPNTSKWSGEKFLQEAHKRVKAIRAAGGREVASGREVAARIDAAGSRDEGEFSHLDNLDGMALEAAVAKLSPEAQERWARAG